MLDIHVPIKTSALTMQEDARKGRTNNVKIINTPYSSPSDHYYKGVLYRNNPQVRIAV